MNLDFNIYECDYNDRSNMITKESSGIVKCKKDFPVYKYKEKNYIFKPLSKTKPYITPLFAISEVFWSNVIKEYFDETAPLYKLAICNGYNNEFPSKYNKGTIVESLTTENQTLINLLEYYISHPEENVNIKDYINYCGIYYDYVMILNSPLFKDHYEYGSTLAKQILISILKNDINYHYENVSLIYDKNKLIKVSPPFDHEYSVPFMFPDNLLLFSTYFGGMHTAFMNGTTNEVTNNNAVLHNIHFIVEKYPEIVKEFLQKMNIFIEDFSKTSFSLPKDYMEPLSSTLYLVYEAIYHEHQNSKTLSDIPKFSLMSLNIEEYSNIIERAILFHSISYQNYLTRVLKK